MEINELMKPETEFRSKYWKPLFKTQCFEILVETEIGYDEKKRKLIKDAAPQRETVTMKIFTCLPHTKKNNSQEGNL